MYELIEEEESSLRMGQHYFLNFPPTPGAQWNAEGGRGSPSWGGGLCWGDHFQDLFGRGVAFWGMEILTGVYGGNLLKWTCMEREDIANVFFPPIKKLPGRRNLTWWSSCGFQLFSLETLCLQRKHISGSNLQWNQKMGVMLLPPHVVFAKSSRLFIEFHKKIFHTIVGKYYTSKGRPVLLVHHNIV